MLIRFTKMHGLGNDFVMLDLISQSIRLKKEHLLHLAARRTGVGCDQILTVEPPTDPDMDFFYRAYNADGSEAEQCGNGARCFLRFVRDRGLTTKTCIKVQTHSGSIECRLESDGNITVNMGRPRLAPEEIPFEATREAITYPICLNASETGCTMSAHRDHDLEIAVVSMGNPHAILLVDDVDTAPVASIGPLLERHERFPNRVNVGFMQVVDRHSIRLRVYERGAGETLACGTGGCAAVVAGRLQGLLDENVSVAFRGGIAKVQWKGNDAPVYLTGPATRVYEGRLHV
ncbi:MAG: diaminopimelate epimerase [Gammaproteobacteria bacterium]|nr:diaminopimelate epimerase [Gammaproteobacteria bacterium]